jgi:hypothetical protein
VSVDRAALVASLRPDAPPAADPARLDVRVGVWIDSCATGAVPPRAEMDDVCRQIDVRHRLVDRYGDDGKPAPDAGAASGPTVAAVAATLLAAAVLAGPDDPWRLKAVNSALKALELDAAVPSTPALRAWAFEILDDATAPAPS